MAYASSVALVIYDITRAGISLDKNMVTPTATHGNKFANDGKTFLYVKNGSAAPITLTFDTPGSVDGQALADMVITVPATADENGKDEMLIGPFTTIFNQSDGNVWVVTSLVTTITMGAYRLANA